MSENANVQILIIKQLINIFMVFPLSIGHCHLSPEATKNSFLPVSGNQLLKDRQQIRSVTSFNMRKSSNVSRETFVGSIS